MSSIAPTDEATAILRHYIKTLAERSGVRWTEANDRDMARLSTLLDQAEPTDTIPPYRSAPPQIDTRVTQELDYGDPAFTRWRQEKAEEERYDQARRIVARR